MMRRWDVGMMMGRGQNYVAATFDTNMARSALKNDSRHIQAENQDFMMLTATAPFA
jgi:hypothetical protein